MEANAIFCFVLRNPVVTSSMSTHADRKSVAEFRRVLFRSTPMRETGGCLRGFGGCRDGSKCDILLRPEESRRDKLDVESRNVQESRDPIALRDAQDGGRNRAADAFRSRRRDDSAVAPRAQPYAAPPPSAAIDQRLSLHIDEGLPSGRSVRDRSVSDVLSRIRLDR